jgi:microcompartment protein CcmL/EutN
MNPSTDKNAIGIVELSSIAAGYSTSDAMLKAADVDMLLARSICSGKYMVMVGGDVAGVKASVDAGVAISEGAVIDSAVLSNIDPSVFPAISGANPVDELEAADAAAKAADIQLIELRLAMALGGKAFATLTGNVAAVQAAVDAGAGLVADKGLLVNRVVIPRPHPNLLNEMV